MTRRFPAVAALAFALCAASAVTGPAQAQDKMEKRSDRITKNFEKLDANNDGVVDRAEAEGKLAKSFKRADADGDGAIDKGEIDAMRAKRAKKAGGKGKGADKVAKRMQRADANRDGRISRDEYMSLTPRWYARADDNRDGRVTTAELGVFMDKKSSRAKR